MIDGSLHLHVGDFRWDTDTIVSMNPVLAALRASSNDSDTAATGHNATADIQAQQQITRRCFDTQTATLHVHYSSF
jgi:hypothetical protein